ncbi:hypothetical protein ID144_14820 [Pseudomonas sp. JM0905a]|uniref:Uncharacterized protein n=1 Tax=Metapseudomonas resinovorans TaxID=53412 RepID=A0ABT4YBJ3_METRE|nr:MULTISPECIES: hypothetical protein [Pseudomonas]MBD2838317.1 hypothetical protein [Pseudomonas sp. JM0905a]MDA8485994.1 hypothetical protein [Pseudomonas resinovorans]
MTTISANSAISSYLGLASRSNSSNSTGTEKTDSRTADKSTAPQDPVADLRRYANALIAQSRGGLFRAMSGGGNAIGSSQLSGTQSTTKNPSSGGADKIQLPDVAELDRDEALKLKDKVQKLIDAGFDEQDSGLGFVGYDGDKKTNSLTTYRDWLQAKGGVSIYV